MFTEKILRHWHWYGNWYFTDNQKKTQVYNLTLLNTCTECSSCTLCSIIHQETIKDKKSLVSNLTDFHNRKKMNPDQPRPVFFLSHIWKNLCAYMFQPLLRQLSNSTIFHNRPQLHWHLFVHVQLCMVYICVPKLYTLDSYTSALSVFDVLYTRISVGVSENNFTHKLIRWI